MLEKNYICYGADIFGGNGGGRATRVVCDDLGNNLHYILSEVDTNGAVVKGAGRRFQRVDLSDRGDVGVEIHLDVNSNPVVAPGERLDVTVGSHTVIVMGRARSGVIMDGVLAFQATRALEKTRYP